MDSLGYLVLVRLRIGHGVIARVHEIDHVADDLGVVIVKFDDAGFSFLLKVRDGDIV
jgi:hypothetical protein